MLQDKNFTLVVSTHDGAKEMSFRVRQMPALTLERWLFRAGKVLVSSGIFDGDITDGQDTFTKLGQKLENLPELLKSVSGLDEAAAFKLVDEMTAQVDCTDSGIIRQLDEQTINDLLDIKSLVQVQKEAFAHNLGFLSHIGLSNSQTGTPESSNAPATNKITIISSSKHKTSVRS